MDPSWNESIGVDRLFATWIVGGSIPYQVLPVDADVLDRLIALLMAFARNENLMHGEPSGGGAEILYATTSAILGGAVAVAVAGDYMSPISDIL